MVDSSRRKLFSLKEIYRALVDGMRTAPLLSKARRREEIDHLFMERIMLAVTEVNGCAICSYAHSKMALNAGMSDSEIRKMMAGSFEDTPEEQLAASLFGMIIIFPISIIHSLVLTVLRRPLIL
ncbi:MAG: carboxymuconolactone decarboxylase family protein [Clostridiales bacterium]|nr:carboxymuconolactone decarboxylase family protein [Clostridiales bacterium]